MNSKTSFEIRRAGDRGHADHGWLQSNFSFSFAEYHDENHMGFENLRVINEDVVQPGTGFGTHPHRDMEIVTYILEGSLEHKDSMGNGSIIKPGDIQRMSAGTGITHSEFNPSDTEAVHLLQIWFLTAQKGITPSYEQKFFSAEDKQGKLKLIASQNAREDSITINQDVDIYASLLNGEETIEHILQPGRKAWLQVARGSLKLNGTDLGPGDGVALDEPNIKLSNGSHAEILLFDMRNRV